MSQVASINSNFPWTRFWRVLDGPREVESDLSEATFLWVPSMEGPPEATPVPTPYQTLPNLLQKPAVILLGRPGAGKTTELKRLFGGHQTHDGRKVLYFDAKACSSEPSAIFSDPSWPAVKDQPVLLVLDGVDELIMECPRYAHIFASRLNHERVSRSPGSLQVVISCRHAEWPEGIDFWPREELIIARLCQLTDEAAQAFVREHLKARENDFWQQVHGQKIEFMAVWPHSLGELVLEFDRHGGKLPGSLFELLKNASVRRCDPSDSDPSRSLRHPDQAVDVLWFHRVAARLAALSCFSGRHRLTFKTSDSEAICGADVFTEPEPWLDGTARLIKENELRELFKTVLFMPLAGGRHSFAHQMFREFMAAWWLAERGITLSQLQSLFGLQEDGKWRHYPQLAAIAAWLASNPAQSAWQDFLIENDPIVLLRADAAALPDAQKKRIAQALLDRAVADRAVDTAWHHHQLRSLVCPGLSEVLKPYLLNYTGAYEAARVLAIQIVEEADVKEAAPFLWQTMRKPQTRLRPQIAYALHQIASDSHEAEWQAVLDGDIPLDEHGSILGAALLALVPRKLKIRDVIDHLIPQRDFGIYGLYTSACDAMIERIEKADAKAVVRQSACHHTRGLNKPHREDEETLVTKALRWLAEDLSDPEALHILAEWWLTSIREYRTLDWDSKPLSLRDLGFEDATKRRSILEACIQHPTATHIRPTDLFWSLLRKMIHIAEDMQWLIQGVLTGTDRSKPIFATWLRNAFYAPDLTSNQKASLTDTWRHSEVLRAQLPAANEGEDIWAAIQRQTEQHQQEFESHAKEAEKSRLEHQSAHDAFLRHLYEGAKDKAAKDIPLAWNWLNAALMREGNPGSHIITLGHLQHLHEKDEPWMKQLPRDYLRSKAPPFPLTDDQERLNTGIDAVCALFAVWNELKGMPDLQDAISEDWLAHVLNQQIRSFGNEGDFTIEAVLSRFAPRSLEAMMRVTLHDYLHQGGLYHLQHIAPFAAEMAPRIQKMLKDHPVQTEGFMNAHGWLAQVNPQAAEEVITYWIEQIPKNSREPAHLLVYASAMANLGGSIWPKIRQRVCADRETTSKVLLRAFGHSHSSSQTIPIAEWDADYLADIVELIFTTFPPEKDPNRDGNVTPRKEMYWVRSRFVAALEERGMTSAVRRLLRLGLKDTHPWLWGAHQRAMNAKIASEWPTVPAADLLQLARDHDISLVRDVAGLQAVMLRMLDSYHIDLKTTRHWGQLRDDKGKPRIENALSNHLAQWLQDKMHVIGHREVETPHGKREDLNVTISRPGHESLQLTIEVKKHDSDGLWDKMESQLKKLYLEGQKGQSRTHGIYLVFWFEDRSDTTFEEASEKLATQARQLSQHPYQIRARVLDCREKTLVPADPHRKSAKQLRKTRK
jgi:hypothetical protein